MSMIGPVGILAAAWTDLGIVALPLLLGLLLVIALAGLYNGLAVARVRTRNALSQIDVQMRRRHDLIPSLVETVQGFMAHERGTLEAVTRARASVQQAIDGLAAGSLTGMRTLAVASMALDGALRGLMARVEAYPDLRASEVMQRLQDELVSTENRVAFARQAFNDAAMRYNERVVTFPGNLVAGWFGFAQAEMWETDEASRAVPGVALRSPS